MEIEQLENICDAGAYVVGATAYQFWHKDGKDSQSIETKIVVFDRATFKRVFDMIKDYFGPFDDYKYALQHTKQQIVVFEDQSTGHSIVLSLSSDTNIGNIVQAQPVAHWRCAMGPKKQFIVSPEFVNMDGEDIRIRTPISYSDWNILKREQMYDYDIAPHEISFETQTKFEIYCARNQEWLSEQIKNIRTNFGLAEGVPLTDVYKSPDLTFLDRQQWFIVMNYDVINECLQQEIYPSEIITEYSSCIGQPDMTREPIKDNTNTFVLTRDELSIPTWTNVPEYVYRDVPTEIDESQSKSVNWDIVPMDYEELSVNYGNEYTEILDSEDGTIERVMAMIVDTMCPDHAEVVLNAIGIILGQYSTESSKRAAVYRFVENL